MVFLCSSLDTIPPCKIQASSFFLQFKSFEKPSTLKSMAFLPKNFKPSTNALRPVITDKARSHRLTAAAGTKLAGANPHAYVILMHVVEVYNLKESSILPYLWLDRNFVHCPIFLTAGFKRSLGLVSVPVWLIILSDQLKIVGLGRKITPTT